MVNALVESYKSSHAVLALEGLIENRKGSHRLRGDPASLTADSSAIRARFGWQPAYDDLDTIVTHALAWERKLSEKAG